MMPVFPYEMPNLLCLRSIYKGLLEPPNDLLHILSKGGLLAIIVDEVLEDIAGEFINPGVKGMCLVYNLPFKNLFELFVHGNIPSFMSKVFTLSKASLCMRSCSSRSSISSKSTTDFGPKAFSEENFPAIFISPSLTRP